MAGSWFDVISINYGALNRCDSQHGILQVKLVKRFLFPLGFIVVLLFGGFMLSI